MFSKEFNKTLASINTEFGGSAISKLGENNSADVSRTSTGRISLDVPFGGGLPDGRIIEFYGSESSGKTTAAMHAIAQHQKEGKGCAFVDYEHAFDPEYAKNLGINVDELVFTQPTHAEQGLSLIDKLVDTNEVRLIIVDSVAAMLPKSELEGDMGNSSIGVHARLMSQAMRKLTSKARKNNCTIVFINQTRDKIGVMFGSPVTTSGGNALKFYASIRVEFYKGTQVKDKKDATDIIANRGHLKVVKNKTFPPYKRSQYDLEFGKGISETGDILDYGVEFGIITKGGSWYSYNETKLGQGREGVKLILEDNPELCDELTSLIKQKL